MFQPCCVGMSASRHVTVVSRRWGWLLLSTTNNTNWTNDEGNWGRMVIHSFVRFVLFVVETRNIRSAGSDSR